MPDCHTLTDEQQQEARTLRMNGASWRTLGKRYGCNYETVRRAVDPDYRMSRAERIYANKSYASAGLPNIDSATCTARRTVARDALSRMAEIPADTRNLTARICGDPLPGRSALDKKNPNARTGLLETSPVRESVEVRICVGRGPAHFDRHASNPARYRLEKI